MSQLSREKLRALMAQAGIVLPPKQLTQLLPLYEKWREAVDAHLYSPELEAEEVAGVFPSHQVWRS